MSARLLLLLVALLARVCLVTLATPSSFPAFSSAKVLASSLAASAGRPVLCAPASHGGGLDGGVSVCAAAAAELRPPPLVTVVSTLFRVEDALAAAWLADVGRQTVAAQVEVLCGLVAGNYAEPVTDLLGKALASGAADPSTYALRVVLFDTDPGLYATCARLGGRTKLVSTSS